MTITELGKLLLSVDGRVSPAAFRWSALSTVGGFLLLHHWLAPVSTGATIALYPVAYWFLLAVSTKRCHDLGHSGGRLLLFLIPLVGAVWIGVELAFARGQEGENRFGPAPRGPRRDHLRVADVPGGRPTVRDVTAVNTIDVGAILRPESIDEVQDIVRRSTGALSIGGGRFSMGGQVASPGSVHIDMRALNRILCLSPVDRTIRVQAGARWCDIQRAIDPYDLSVAIMQTYANFTVGGSISVNAHGRYMGRGPLILSLRSLSVVLANGDRVDCSPTDRSELFFGVVGGYGGLGLIVEAELALADNDRVARRSTRLPTAGYLEHFRQTVRTDPDAVFHNADLYPSHYRRARSVTWRRTDECVTEPARLMSAKASHPLERYLFWAVSETPFGNWRREFIFEPLHYLGRRVHWRNYEAGYDVAELEPATRRFKTFVLQEYFVPVARFDEFVPKMAEIFQRHRVNVVNVSIRHALADSGSLLAWAPNEVFAFVVYYKQAMSEAARHHVAVWTRELVDAALAVDGRYYLPYQVHATDEQFHRAYPRAREWSALKERVDPDFRFRGALWDRYHRPPTPPPTQTGVVGSQYRAVFSDVVWSDRFFLFLQNIYHLYPEADFHALLREARRLHADDERAYRYVQEKLPGISPFLAPLRYALPALAAQKREMTRQTLELLGPRRALNGLIEIGSTGRYAGALRRRVRLTGDIVTVAEAPPSMSPVDLAERGQLRPLGRYHPLGDYAPLPDAIPAASVDLVTCFIGLHHCPPELLDGFLASIARVLRPGGLFILRDHDVTTAAMNDFVCVVHSVFNAGLSTPWSTDLAERRHFAPLSHWVASVERHGLTDLGQRLLQAHDPTANTLIAFEKAAVAS